MTGRLEEVENIGKQLEQMMRDERKLSNRHADAKAATKEAENLKKQQLANVDAAKSEMKQLQDNIDEALEKLRKDISWTGWEPEWDDNHMAFITRLNDEAADLTKAEQT